MRRPTIIGMVALLLTTLATTGAATGAATGTTAAPAAEPYCGITWGSGPKTAGSLSPASLLTTRTGRHDCYDRVVFEFDGPVTGYDIGYRDVFTEGQGQRLNPYVAGGDVLGVSLRAPANGYPAASGGHVAAVVGYDTLRDVMFGGTFEGYTTFAVGVRARLPFQVTVLGGPGTHSRIVLDVAHRWQLEQ